MSKTFYEVWDGCTISLGDVTSFEFICSGGPYGLHVVCGGVERIHLRHDRDEVATLHDDLLDRLTEVNR